MVEPNRQDETPACWACHQGFTVRCIRCEQPACLACDYCSGCGQIFCEACNADPLMIPELFPGDTWAHPQNVG